MHGFPHKASQLQMNFDAFMENEAADEWRTI
jgi:hypothetical protein